MENWDNLRFYLAVARCGTVSAAAKELAVSHATVLRRVEQLEQELGVKLFKHLQSGYQLSEAGKDLFQQVLKISNDVQDIERQFQGNDEVLAGRLRVTQPENELIEIYPLYAEFSRMYPDIQLEISPSLEIKNLNQHEAEVAIRFIHQPPDLLVGRNVGKVRFSAYASKEYLSRFDSMPKVADCDWIVWRDANKLDQRSRQENKLYDLTPDPKIVMFSTSASDIVSSVRAGIGVALISHSIAHQYEELVPIPDVEMSSRMNMWVLTHRDLRNVARVKCFMRFISDGLMKLNRLE